MKVNSFKRVVCMILAVVCCIGVLALPVAASSDTQTTANANLEETKQYLAADSYAEYTKRYEDAQIPSGDKTYVATIDLVASANGTYVVDETRWKDNIKGTQEHFRAGAVYAPAEGGVFFDVNVDATGMYYLLVEYYTIAHSVNSIEKKLYIDSDIPFQEASRLFLGKTWVYDYEVDETTGEYTFKKDLAGNEMAPLSHQTSVWKTYFCADANGYSNEYYKFYMSAGSHTIEFRAVREPMVISSVKLVPVDAVELKVPSYEEYLQAVKALGATPVSSEHKVVIQAEKPDYVSDSAVIMASNKTSSATQPTSASHSLLNVIGATSYNSAGQWAAYNFTVPKTGLYNLTLRYLQNVLDGMFVSRAVKLTSYGQGNYQYGLADGTPTVPFEEAFSTRYNYDKNWVVDQVSDGFTDFEFYFEEGVNYTLYLEVSLGALAPYIKRVNDVLTILNDCYMQVLKLTGADPDPYSNYNFDTLLPDVIWYLNYCTVELQNIRDELAEICGGDIGAHLASMDNIIRLIGEMASDEREIAGNLTSLKSNLGTLGTWVSTSQSAILVIDLITVQAPDAEMEKEKAGFFASIWFEIKSFFLSFFIKYDQMGVTNTDAMKEEALTVWVSAGRDQMNILRNMMDTFYLDYCENDKYYNNPESPVALKLIAGGLLQSILAGTGPDVYMSMGAGDAVNYAIRDAVLPINEIPEVSQQEYDETMAWFHKALVDNYTLLGKVYGMPNGMSFPMMFYRSDALIALNSDIPETWDELLSLLPALQGNNMEIGLSYTEVLNYFLYQSGGSYWKYEDDPVYQGAQIGLDSDEALEAFEFAVSLFTDYSFPVKYDETNRFRSGEIPICLTDYVGGNNMLVVYATELSGLWGFTHIPGQQNYDENGNMLYNEDGSRDINFTTLAGGSASIIPKTGEDRMRDAWQFMKWNVAKDTAAEYANRMIALLGPSGKQAVSNMTALDDLSWTAQELVEIRKQMSQLKSMVPYPGSYIINRYTNFAFLAAVNDGEDAVEALRGYISDINAEITRKREEYGLATLGPGETPPGYND